MPRATDDRLGEVRRRIAHLEVNAQQGSADARLRTQQYLDGAHRAESLARAALHERAAAVDGSLERLENELELATHRVAAEFATTAEEFRDAAQALLHRWDVVLDRMQAQAAAETPPAREQSEAALADLRQRRLAIGEALTDIHKSPSSSWHHTRTRVLSRFDELKRKTDEASSRHGGIPRTPTESTLIGWTTNRSR